METNKVVGVVKRRRDFSKLLSFFDMQEMASTQKVQMVVDGWEISKEIVAGFTVKVEGVWEILEGGKKRFIATKDKVVVLAAREKGNPWALASMHESWRKEQGIQSRTKWKQHNEDRKAFSLSPSSSTLSSSSSLSPPICTLDSNGNDSELDIHPELASKSKHNKVFAQFLIETYGLAWLKSNKVVDIAGGRGQLAEYLMLEYDIPVTLIEPKPMRLNKTSRKRCRKWFRARHLEIPEEISPVTQLCEEFYGIHDDNVSTEALEALKNCGLIVGMHPDQATGAIVEAANELGKCFAVVPCCVFARLFPERRTSCGKPVVLYSDLISHILASDENIRESKLAFEGRNIVLFREREETDDN